MTDLTDVPIRDASTVVLLRDRPDGLETWLISRVVGMVFAAGMTVFPGGRVDDEDATLPIIGASLADMATRFAAGEQSARALVGAAVRETYEETGVLLTTPVADLSGARHDVEAGRVTFASLLAQNGLSVNADAVRPWSRWITPPGEKRRYDTRFFVAGLPADAQAQDVTTESAHAAWVPIAAALDEARRGERRMLPPTVATLASLADFGTVADVLAASAGRSLDPIQPTIRVEGDQLVAELADGTTFTLPKSMFT